jgi:hypothetical protein
MALRLVPGDAEPRYDCGVSAIVAPALIAAAALVVGYRLAIRVGGRLGLKTPRDLPVRKRRRLWLVLAAAAGISLVSAWAISSGRSALGVGVLAAVYILPEFVLVPLRVRRSRRRAAESRARRGVLGGK